MLKSAADRLRRAVRGVGAAEERQDISGALPQSAAEASQLDECGRDTTGQRTDDGLQGELAEPLPVEFR